MAKGSGGSPKSESRGGDGEITEPTPKGDAGSVVLRECVSFRGRCSKKAFKSWRGRLKSRSASYLQLFKYLPYGAGPTVFSSLTLYDKEGYSSSQGFHHGYEDNVAWVDLTGRLVNADTLTGIDKVGGQLGAKEALVWEEFCPLQRVLIVAVVAAAASAAKVKNANEVVRLQRVIKKREKALVLMREELSNLWNQVDMQKAQLNPEKGELSPSDSLDELVDLLSQVDIHRSQSNLVEQSRSGPSCVNDTESNSINMESLEFALETFSPVVNRQLNFSDLTRRISPIKEESPISGGPGLELIEKMIMSNNWIESLDMRLLLEEASGEEYECAEESLNKDAAFEQIVSGTELEKESTESSKHDLCLNRIWDGGNNVVSDPIQDNGSANEWLSETSSVIMDPFSPQPSEKQPANRLGGIDDSPKEWWWKSAAEENSLASRARCASLILDVKKQVILLLDEAASSVLETLSFVREKVRQLEGPETHALTPRKPEEAWSEKSQASTAIKENVNRISIRVATLQTAMVQLWDSLGPEAMSALDISPSDFDDYLTNLQIAKILNDDACELSTASASIRSWQDWFRRGFDNPESSFLRRIQVSGEKTSDVQSEVEMFGNLDKLSEWPPSGDLYAGRKAFMNKEEAAISNIGVRRKVEMLIGPLLEIREDTASEEKSRNIVAVAEDLVFEFEKSAAKFAEMESHMKSLKKYVKACDVKRKQVERKLLEAWEQDSKNQVKASNEIMELKRQVRLKESAYQQLITSRKALVSSKTKEIAELREDCRRHNIALQDMASAAKATQESGEKRLAMLEEICRKKDSSIMSLKQEIFELEGKVQELQACQTPAQLRPMNLPPAGRDTDTESTDDLFDNENSYRMFGDECQLRTSYQSMCGSENRRTSWGSDLSAQEFHIIDTPWSSELTAGQDFNIIEEAAFQGRSLSIFQNVTSSNEFLRGSLRKLDTTPGGGLDTSSSGDPNGGNVHRKDNNIPNYRKELSKSASGLPSNVTSRPKRRDEVLRASTGVLSAVGPNTPFKPRRSTSVSKERSRSESSFNNSLNNGVKPKENSNSTHFTTRSADSLMDRMIERTVVSPTQQSPPDARENEVRGNPDDESPCLCFSSKLEMACPVENGESSPLWMVLDIMSN